MYMIRAQDFCLTRSRRARHVRPYMLKTHEGDPRKRRGFKGAPGRARVSKVEPFTIIVIAGFTVVIGIFLIVGFWHPRRASQITDKDRQARWATQAEVEETEIPGMIEGQNMYRRKRGQADATEEEFRGRAAERSRES